MDGANQSSLVSVGMCSASSGSRYPKIKILSCNIFRVGVAVARPCPPTKFDNQNHFLGRGAGDPEQCAFPR